MDITLLILLSVAVILVVLLRILYTLIHMNICGHVPDTTGPRTKPVKTIVVIGSGGHTTEMLRMVSALDKDKYRPRYYIVADTDKHSTNKIQEAEEISTQASNYEIVKIPRSREVKQSWSTSLFSFIYAQLYTFPAVFRIRPELILCNGPGTCVPVCIAGFVLKAFFLGNPKVVYIESICRVTSLSLSARLLWPFVDSVLVQWPDLKKANPKTRYIGRFV